jgi:hypothetical protein
MHLYCKFNHKNDIQNIKNGGKEQYSYISPLGNLENVTSPYKSECNQVVPTLPLGWVLFLLDISL